MYCELPPHICPLWLYADRTALRCARLARVCAAEQSDYSYWTAYSCSGSLCHRFDMRFARVSNSQWSRSAARLRFGAAQARARKDVEAVPRRPRRVGKGAYLCHSNSRCHGRAGEDHSTYNIVNGNPASSCVHVVDTWWLCSAAPQRSLTVLFLRRNGQVGKTGASGQTLNEAKTINKCESLFRICIAPLAVPSILSLFVTSVSAGAIARAIRRVPPDVQVTVGARERHQCVDRQVRRCLFAAEKAVAPQSKAFESFALRRQFCFGPAKLYGCKPPHRASATH